MEGGATGCVRSGSDVGLGLTEVPFLGLNSVVTLVLCDGGGGPLAHDDWGGFVTI